MQQKQRANRPDSFERGVISPEVIEAAIRHSQRLRSEAMAAGLAATGRGISRAARALWHAAFRRRPASAASPLKPAQHPCP